MKKKLLRGFIMLSTAAALCIGGPAIQASAEDTEISKQFDPACVTVDYANQQLKIVEDAAWSVKHGYKFDIEILYGVSTVKTTKNKKTKETKTTLTTPSWDVYSFNPATEDDVDRTLTIDLSSLNRAKDNYIQIKGNTFSEPITLKIPAVQKDLKMKYNKSDGTVTLTNKRGKEPDLDASAEFEYRTQYGNWKPFDINTELTTFQQRGATLYIRVKAPDSVPLNSEDQVEYIGGIMNTAGEELNILSAGSFPGVELKTTVSKLANAPAAKINYVKGTITIPKGSWYRVIKSDDKNMPDWCEDAETSAITYNIYTTPDLEPLMKEGGAIETYKPETERTPASKIGHIDCTAIKEITARTSDDTTPASLTETVDGSQVVSLVYDEDEKMDVIDETFVSASLEKTANNRYTLVLSNTSTDAYDVIVQASNNPPNPSIRPTKKIAAATEKKTVQEVKITKIAEGRYVFIRKAGNQAKKTWTTSYIELGKIILPSEDE